ncbi:MAG: PIN domain-containing protein [Streptosporangiales bacterium]|nr:PIN domain-containing protein [Streptosporangiales bacterium]
MIVVDASVLIGHLDGADPHHEKATQMLLDAAEYPLGASTITIAEVLVRPAQGDRLSAAQSALDALALQEIPLEPGAAFRLARLRAETRLKLPDCCVLLAALECSAERALTLDDRLRAQALRLGIGTG